MSVERMSDFFTARLNGYDEHMMNDVEGCRQGYIRMAGLIPGNVAQLLDLGCGTGLELDEIFRIKPKITVTGIDLTQAMLDKLKQKHPDKDLTLIKASYFDCEFGIEKYDAAISFQTMYHFSHADKIKLYSKVYYALKPGGKYIEGDYMITEQKDEDFYFSENERIRKEQNIPDGEFCHYDTPCTVGNQIALLRKAGFQNAEMVWRMGNTTIIIAEKQPNLQP
ncbi:MAG: class I SAM-dependent methyltransferase [Clostridia bacterium]|nr:class I SAM-dependent methyltransferase [Clostridia bacterium]